jgi:hypothetical protein
LVLAEVRRDTTGQLVLGQVDLGEVVVVGPQQRRDGTMELVI